MTHDLLAAARAAVRAASSLLQTARPEEIRSKDNPRDLVTEWDLRSEELIRTVLEEHAPGIPVLGEEAGQGGGQQASGLRWLVDPIDGTVNFAHGLPIWCVSIAVEDRGTLLAGVVGAPLLGWWFEASRGGGAHDSAGLPLRVSTTPRIDRALLTTGFPYDLATTPVNNFAEWAHMQRVAGACRRLGSAALDLCCVARGWFDGYWELSLKAWDVGAGALIVQEAGGTVTDTRGGAFDPHAGEVVATNGAIHDQLIAELARVEHT
ncbi:MAG: inositol monophosphatase [Deltaproteobacteria bacterium]|nr:inositol monophosphatase [Deltaproteobacteria bacterium]